MPRLKLVFGGIAFFALLLILHKIYTQYNCDEECEFTDIFIDANLNMSSTGKVPKWADDIELCIYGDGISENTKAIFNKAIRFYSSVIKKEVIYSYHTNVSMCPLDIEVYIIVVTGRVQRSTVSGNYENIMRRENITILDELPSSFYESAFAQIGFLADKAKASAAILINQIGENSEETATEYISSGVYEELFQVFTVASDLSAGGDINSVLQEKYVHTPSISSGIYSAQEAQKYLATRPRYLCTFDLMHLILLYDSGNDSLEISEFTNFINANYDELERKAQKVYKKAALEVGQENTSLMC